MTHKKINRFQFLSQVDPILVSLGELAEGYPENDPHAALIRLRQFGDLLGRKTGQRFGVFIDSEDNCSDLLDCLRNVDGIPGDILSEFHKLRMTGNNALHEFQGDVKDVKNNISAAIKLGQWFVSLDQEQVSINSIGQSFPPHYKIQPTENEPPLESPNEERNDAFQDFSGKDLSGRSFAGNDLTDHNFSDSILYKADFSNTNLQSTKFIGADIRGADFTGSKNLKKEQIKDSLFDKNTKIPEEYRKLI